MGISSRWLPVLCQDLVVDRNHLAPADDGQHTSGSRRVAGAY